MTAIPSINACKAAVTRALRELGGEADRVEIVRLAADLGSFTPAERATPAPSSKPQYDSYLAYNLSWAITHLRHNGTITNVSRGRWRLT